MAPTPLELIALLALLVPAGLDGDVPDAGWPHLRGPDLDGQIASSVFEQRDFALDIAWKAGLGSGYSGIAIADGSAVTMGSDGTNDVVVAYDSETGAERWRHALGPTYRGHDGSADGPISSPLIHGDAVYALGPRGVLVALSLAGGQPLWRHDLVADFGSVEPDYGFSTTPVAEGELVIVQLGGPDGRSLGALDARTGELRWSAGDGSVEYQSPAIMTLAGRPAVVAFRGRVVAGHDLRTGAVLWQHELGDRDRTGSAIATRMDERRFFAVVGGALAVFEVTRGDDGAFEVAEVMRTRELGSTYAPPVHHAGHFYGFRRDFLTCVDASTGERVWRSRPPGGKGLILVSDRLVIFGAHGRVVVAPASPDGYVEEASLEVFDGSGLTWPSFADGRIYLRNPRDVAAVAVVKASEVTGGRAAASSEIETDFTRWVKDLEQAEDRSKQVEELLAGLDRTPIVEGNVVTFIYHGDVDDVAIAASMNDSSRPDPLHRVEGTDLHYRSYRLAPASRVQYQFHVDMDRWEPDPRNPDTVAGSWGDQRLSVVAMPGYQHPTHIEEPAAETDRGTTETFTFPGWDADQTREITVYLPHAYAAEPERRFPLLIVQEGTAWIEKGRMVNTLDNVIGKSVAPVVVVFLDTIGPWWLEAGGSETGAFADMVAERLVPELERRYRLKDDPGARAIMGARDYGLSALYTAFKHPDVIGQAAVQSVGMRNGAQLELLAMMERRPRANLNLYVDWSLYEDRGVDQDFDFGEDARLLVESLENNGYDFTGGEAIDSHGWGGWRARTDVLLEALFPPDSAGR